MRNWIFTRTKTWINADAVVTVRGTPRGYELFDAEGTCMGAATHEAVFTGEGNVIPAQPGYVGLVYLPASEDGPERIVRVPIVAWQLYGEEPLPVPLSATWCGDDVSILCPEGIVVDRRNRDFPSEAEWLANKRSECAA